MEQAAVILRTLISQYNRCDINAQPEFIGATCANEVTDRKTHTSVQDLIIKLATAAKRARLRRLHASIPRKVYQCNGAHTARRTGQVVAEYFPTHSDSSTNNTAKIPQDLISSNKLNHFP